MMMDWKTFATINGPFIFLNIIANVFFIFCMVRPLNGERIKQPLKLLFCTLISCTLTFYMGLLVQLISFLTFDKFKTSKYQFIVSYSALKISLFINMTSSVWLSFYYSTQIVPSQRAFFIWTKKNIKPIIYCIWLGESILGLCDVGVLVFCNLSLTCVSDTFGSYNFTMYNDNYAKPTHSKLPLPIIINVTLFANFFLCLIVMVISNGSTAVYLSRHMHRMVVNGQPLTCPRFKSQVRVTATGILQGVIYLFPSSWSLYNYVSKDIAQPTVRLTFINATVINLYMVGTSFNMGAGQSVFRQRAADVWLKAVKWCKPPKAQKSGPGG